MTPDERLLELIERFVTAHELIANSLDAIACDGLTVDLQSPTVILEGPGSGANPIVAQVETF